MFKLQQQTTTGDLDDSTSPVETLTPDSKSVSLNATKEKAESFKDKAERIEKEVHAHKELMSNPLNAYNSLKELRTQSSGSLSVLSDALDSGKAISVSGLIMKEMNKEKKAATETTDDIQSDETI